MRLVFANQYASLLALVIALLVAITIYTRKMRKNRAMVFGNYETLEKVAGHGFIRTSNILLLVKLGAVIILILGISGPQLVQEKNVANASYVIAVDSSSSMFTEDIEPTRFDAAKSIAKNILGDMTNNSRIGIVSYSGSVKVESEVSKNLGEKKRAINNITIGEEAGTAIGDAVISSGTLLEGEERKKVILMTDGENNVGSSVNKSIRFARNQNFSVYTVGLGTNQSREQFGVVAGNNASRADFPNLDVEELTRLSNRTGGKSVFVSENTDISPEFVGISRRDVETDLANFFVFLGCLLLIVEWILKSTGIEVIP